MHVGNAEQARDYVNSWVSGEFNPEYKYFVSAVTNEKRFIRFAEDLMKNVKSLRIIRHNESASHNENAVKVLIMAACSAALRQGM